MDKKLGNPTGPGAWRLMLAALGLVMAACSAGVETGSTATSAADGNTTAATEVESSLEVLRVGLTGSDIESLNIFNSLTSAESTSIGMTIPWLVNVDGEGNVQPGFAEDWEISDDGLQATLHLHPGAVWSDGEALDADDVAFSINMLKDFADSATGRRASYVEVLEQATAVDATTVQVDYGAPDAAFLVNLSNIPILPEHIWGELATGDGTAITEFPNDPPVVSGGPYTIDEFRASDFIGFTRNPTYFGTPLPAETMGLKLYSSSDAMLAAVQSGELDLIDRVPAELIDPLKEAGMVVAEQPSLSWDMVAFNTNPNKPNAPELLNFKVREALDYGVDRERIVEVAYFGHAEPGSSIVPPGLTTYFNDELGPPPFDIDRGNAILDELGYERGSDGVRVADGNRMAYEVVLPNEMRAVGGRAFEIIQEGWAELGVEITQRPLDNTAAWEAVTGPDSTFMDADISIWAWSSAPDPNHILGLVTCGQIGGFSDTAFCDEAYDQQFETQAGLLDVEERAALVKEMQAFIYEQRPYLVYLYRNYAIASSPELGDLALNSAFYSVFNLDTLSSIG